MSHGYYPYYMPPQQYWGYPPFHPYPFPHPDHSESGSEEESEEENEEISFQISNQEEAPKAAQGTKKNPSKEKKEESDKGKKEKKESRKKSFGGKVTWVKKEVPKQETQEEAKQEAPQEKKVQEEKVVDEEETAKSKSKTEVQEAKVPENAVKSEQKQETEAKDGKGVWEENVLNKLKDKPKAKKQAAPAAAAPKEKVQPKKEEKPVRKASAPKKEAVIPRKKSAAVEKTEPEKPREPSKRYTLEFLLTYKGKCVNRPVHMKDIDIPLIKAEDWRKGPGKVTPFQETVKEIRGLLNKLSMDNFPKISETFLFKLHYTVELMQELARLLFNKSIKDVPYIDLYMGLYDKLNRKFNKKRPSPDNYDFRGYFVSHCQHTFENKDSDEYMRYMPKDMDADEKRYKKRQRIFGNMKLIGELYIRGALPDAVVITCINTLFTEVNEEKVENLCHLLKKIGKSLYEYYAYVNNQTNIKTKPKLKAKNFSKENFDEYIDKLAEIRQGSSVTSRVKFMIQDVLEARDKEWSLCFNQFVVRKKILKPGLEDTLVYRKKEKTSFETRQEKVEVFEEDIEDPKYLRTQRKKTSINETNIFGINIEKYQKIKLDETVRLKVHNLIDEYYMARNTEEALENFHEMHEEFMKEKKLPKKIPIGLMLLYAFSKKESEFVFIIEFLISLVTNEGIEEFDLLEGIYVCLANFYDCLIDYPSSKENFSKMLDILKKSQILRDEELAEKYKNHVEQIEKQIEEEYNELEAEVEDDNETKSPHQALL
eukprot:TRINITY_DN553_c0_g1_i1.p1 TRINITY_DN553_c0_g1~~TRINITY_DN553_c0_g1_i1.p1  ORF type:complete len:766 (+),score=198.79 TRINITY_DN553_c0_g1_i1:82-2379(+)